MNKKKQELDKIAKEYHENCLIPDIHIENISQEYFIKWLLDKLPVNSEVLELGYGDGIVTEALASFKGNVTLVEGASTLARTAKDKFPHINCIESLFEDYDVVGKYDLILAAHVLEHMDNPKLLLRKMSSWLKANGEIIVVVPNRNSIHRQLAVLMNLQPQLDSLSNRDLQVGHQRVYSLELLSEELRSSGFYIEESAGFFLKPLPNSMMLDYPRELLWALNEISPELPKELLANIAIRARKSN